MLTHDVTAQAAGSLIHWERLDQGAVQPQVNSHWGSCCTHVISLVGHRRQISKLIDGDIDVENEMGDGGLSEEVMLLQGGRTRSMGRAELWGSAFQQLDASGEGWRQDQAWGLWGRWEPRGWRAGLPGLRFHYVLPGKLLGGLSRGSNRIAAVRGNLFLGSTEL